MERQIRTRTSFLVPSRQRKHQDALQQHDAHCQCARRGAGRQPGEAVVGREQMNRGAAENLGVWDRESSGSKRCTLLLLYLVQRTHLSDNLYTTYLHRLAHCCYLVHLASRYIPYTSDTYHLHTWLSSLRHRRRAFKTEIKRSQSLTGRTHPQHVPALVPGTLLGSILSSPTIPRRGARIGHSSRGEGR